MRTGLRVREVVAGRRGLGRSWGPGRGHGCLESNEYTLINFHTFEDLPAMTIFASKSAPSIHFTVFLSSDRLPWLVTVPISE